MKNTLARDTLKNLSETCIRDSEKAVRKCRANPILVRKKFEMKDVYFRKNQPDIPLMRCELAFDYEFGLIMLSALVIVLLIMKKCCGKKKKREKNRKVSADK